MSASVKTGKTRGAERQACLSPTALRAFDTCRRQYELTYLERERGREDVTAALVFGNALHQALAFLYRLPAAERTEASAHRALRHFWSRIDGRAEAFLTDEEEAAWGHSALECLSRYCHDRAAELTTEPVAVELWLRAALGNGLVVGGRVDRIDRSKGPHEGLVVIDYKTGTCRFDEADELVDDRGAQVYAWATTQVLGEPVSEVCFYYLREGFPLRWAVEPDDLEMIERRLMAASREVHLAEVFPPSPGAQCEWCRHRHGCDAAANASLAYLPDQAEVPF